MTEENNSTHVLNDNMELDSFEDTLIKPSDAHERTYQEPCNTRYEACYSKTTSISNSQDHTQSPPISVFDMDDSEVLSSLNSTQSSEDFESNSNQTEIQPQDAALINNHGDAIVGDLLVESNTTHSATTNEENPVVTQPPYITLLPVQDFLTIEEDQRYTNDVSENNSPTLQTPIHSASLETPISTKMLDQELSDIDMVTTDDATHPSFEEIPGKNLLATSLSDIVTENPSTQLLNLPQDTPFLEEKNEESESTQPTKIPSKRSIKSPAKSSTKSPMKKKLKSNVEPSAGEPKQVKKRPKKPVDSTLPKRQTRSSSEIGVATDVPQKPISTLKEVVSSQEKAIDVEKEITSTMEVVFDTEKVAVITQEEDIRTLEKDINTEEHAVSTQQGTINTEEVASNIQKEAVDTQEEATDIQKEAVSPQETINTQEDTQEEANSTPNELISVQKIINVRVEAISTQSENVILQEPVSTQQESIAEQLNFEQEEAINTQEKDTHLEEVNSTKDDFISTQKKVTNAQDQAISTQQDEYVIQQEFTSTQQDFIAEQVNIEQEDIPTQTTENIIPEKRSRSKQPNISKSSKIPKAQKSPNTVKKGRINKAIKPTDTPDTSTISKKIIDGRGRPRKVPDIPNDIIQPSTDKAEVFISEPPNSNINFVNLDLDEAGTNASSTSSKPTKSTKRKNRFEGTDFEAEEAKTIKITKRGRKPNAKENDMLKEKDELSTRRTQRRFTKPVSYADFDYPEDLFNDTIPDNEESLPMTVSSDNTTTVNDNDDVATQSEEVKLDQSNTPAATNPSKGSIEYLLSNRNSALADEKIQDQIPEWINALSKKDKQDLATYLCELDCNKRGEKFFWNDECTFLEDRHFWDALSEWQEILSLGGFEKNEGNVDIELEENAYKDDNYESYWGEKWKETTQS